MENGNTEQYSKLKIELCKCASKLAEKCKVPPRLYAKMRSVAGRAVEGSPKEGLAIYIKARK